jgi:4-hydroxy-4-methyl-2-oxoglutarate aldolase
VIVADDDGVVLVPHRDAAEVAAAAGARERSEAANRARYQAGELSLDVYGMRERLEQKGLKYLDQAADD